MERTLALFIPIVAIIVVFVFLYFNSKHEKEVKEKMIEQGMNPKDSTAKETGSGALKFGGLLIGGGLGLFLAKMLVQALDMHDPEAIYFGLIALFGGIGLVVAHNVARKQYKEDRELYES